MLIGVDHGNKQIKSVHCEPFVSGLKQSVTRRQASPSVLPRLARERLAEPWAAIWRQLSSRPAFFMNCSVPAARSLPCTSPNPIPQGSRMSRLWKRLRRAANGKRRRSFSLSESAKSRRSFLPCLPMARQQRRKRPRLWRLRRSSMPAICRCCGDILILGGNHRDA